MKSEEFSGLSAQMRENATWLSSEDLLDAGDQLVTIEKVYKHKDAEFEDGRKQDVYALKFVGKQKQMILNNTNRKTLVTGFGTTRVADWIGKQITIFVVSGIRKPGGKRGETTNGIRLRV